MAEENYIDINTLPKSLLKEENKRLIELMLEGDFDARQKLIESNMRLVTYRVSTRFGTVNYDKEELVSIGNLGLIKAVDTFDSKREVSLATYAIKCIDNEIYMFLRKLKKVQADISLSQPVNIFSKDKERHIEDFLSDGLDIEEEYLNAETILRVRELVKKLPPALRETVNLYYGFNGGKRYTQEEIAKKANCLQPTIHKRLKKAEKLIKRELEKQEQETHNYTTPASTKAVTTSKKAITANQEFKLPKKITRNKTFYEILNEFSKEQVDKAISVLDDEEKQLILTRYNGNFNNRPTGKLTSQQSNHFYHVTISKIKRIIVRQEGKVEQANVTSRKNPQKQYSRKTFYELLSPYPKEWVDEAFESLTEEEKQIILDRYSGNLNFEPVKTTSTATCKKIHKSIIPKIKHAIAVKHSAKGKCKTIYEYFCKYSREQIDKAIASLSDEENKIVLLRYAGDLNNPPIGKLTESVRVNKKQRFCIHHIWI